ncbi:hypothetical protein [Aromatoleum anaerobium]|uniref:Uncharacterized protein n=1 Tax=Aromatoleum anaerobium TaxID=182180 RepID=A0ABX1PPB6_9RHOO|nr:hypothetical protein [Aromatoleum anaerobium]MCK0506340.1 hypothetical protein [Aromatoleum anaerobium]
MGGLDLLGGIGKGLMQGTTAIQATEKLRLQEAQQADQAKYRDGVLEIAREDQTFQREDRALKEAERQRLAGYERLVQETAAELGEDATPEQLGAEILKRGLKTGRIPQKEVEPLMKQAKAFRQAGATNALRRGDLPELARILSGPQFFNRTVQLGMTPGTDETGRPANRYQILDETGAKIRDFSQFALGGVLGADDLIEEQEQLAKLQKTRSEIGENEAQTRAADALAHQRNQAPAPGTGGRSAAASSPTTGFSAKVREQATRAALARKVASGTATPEELDLFGVLQDQAAQGSAYQPPEVKKASYWRSASTEAVDAEVERQLAVFRTQTRGDAFAQMQLEDPAVVEELRRDIRLKLGAGAGAGAGAGSGDVPSITTGNRPGQAPQATDQRGGPVAAPNNLDRYFR